MKLRMAGGQFASSHARVSVRNVVVVVMERFLRGSPVSIRCHHPYGQASGRRRDGSVESRYFRQLEAARFGDCRQATAGKVPVAKIPLANTSWRWITLQKTF
jgi:hypothetical protein